MAAKSGNIASFVFVNSAKFHKNSIKPIEVFLFSRHTCQESVKFCLFLRPCMNNSCPPYLFSVVYIALASGTRISWKKQENDVFRVCYVSSKETKGESLATAINNGTAILLPAVTMHTRHYA